MASTRILVAAGVGFLWGWAVVPAARAGVIGFTGASDMGVDPGGVGIGYSAGENSTGLITLAGVQVVNTAYLAPGTLPGSPSFVNTAVTPDLGLSLASPGSYSFTLYRTDFSTPTRALNLFFDESASPGISAYGLLDSTSFAATGSADLVPLSDGGAGTVTGSGSLFYDNGTDTVTLTAMAFQTGITVGGFTLGVHDLTVGGTTSGLGAVTFTLDVTADPLTEVPEPGSMGLLFAGLAALGAARRRRGSTA